MASVWVATSSLLAVAALVAGVHLGRRRGSRVHPVVPTEHGPCVTLRSPFGQHVPPLALTGAVDMDAALYNPSLTRVPSSTNAPAHCVSVSRLSNYTFCPGTHVASMLVKPCRDRIMLIVDGTPFDVRIPARWWGAQVPGGLQDARPFALAPGVLALACTLVTRGAPARMALVTLRLPLPGAGRGVAVPSALIALADAGRGPQKNWMPCVHADRVYLIKHTSPQTTVSLPLDALLSASRLCTMTPRVEFEDAHDNARAPGAAFSWRGNTPLIPFDGARLAVVHRVHHDSWRTFVYDHALVLFEDAPPFRLVCMSQPFRLHARAPGGAATGFTYVAGLCEAPAREPASGGQRATEGHHSEQHAPVVLTFGVDDCFEGSVTWTRQWVRDLLTRGAHAPLLHIQV